MQINAAPALLWPLPQLAKQEKERKIIFPTVNVAFLKPAASAESLLFLSVRPKYEQCYE